jgi:hypothetical protein
MSPEMIELLENMSEADEEFLCLVWLLVKDLERPRKIDVAASKLSLQAVLHALDGRQGKGDQE